MWYEAIYTHESNYRGSFTGQTRKPGSASSNRTVEFNLEHKLN
jgi:hypothetical protein